MLKPKRQIFKDEIKKDPFIENILSVQNSFKQFKNLYQRVGIVLLLSILTIFIYSYQKNKNNIEGYTQLKSVLTYNISSDTLYINNLFDVYDNFKNTQSSIESAFYIGKKYFELQDFINSAKFLNYYYQNGENIFLIKSAMHMLVELNLDNKDYAKAIKYQKKIKKYDLSDKQKAKNIIKLSQLYLLDNNLSKSSYVLKDITPEMKKDIEIINKLESLSIIK